MKKHESCRLLMAGYCAESFAAERAEDLWEQLRSRYSLTFLEEGLNQMKETQALLAKYHFPAGALYMAELGATGIFGALWHMGEELSCGLTAELDAIPVRQAAIEVCEFLDVNPYMQDSRGAYLIAAEDDIGFIEQLRTAGIPVSVIGYIASGNDRIIVKGGEKRFLTRL